MNITLSPELQERIAAKIRHGEIESAGAACGTGFAQLRAKHGIPR
jgi:hypothetical protein